MTQEALLRTPTARSSPVTKLPMEVVEIIVARLICDTPSLAYSLTCQLRIDHLDIANYAEDLTML